MLLNAVRAIADCGYEYEENKGIFLLWGTRKDLLFIGNFHRFFPFSPVFSGKVNHFAANSRHFPAENVDFTTISPFFPGKVNHFAANSRRFPPPSLPQPPNTHYPQYEVLGSCGNNLGSSGNKLTVPPETSSVHPRFFYFTFYRLMITFVGCFGIEIKQICLHLNC